jgi:HEPN domain-containing protein
VIVVVTGPTGLQGRWLDHYAEMVVADLMLAADLYFNYKDRPVFLMSSLFHAQQAAEKSVKLLFLAGGLVKPGELKELGHYPLINTLYKAAGKASDITKYMRGQALDKLTIRTKTEFTKLKVELERIRKRLKGSSCVKNVSSALDVKIDIDPGFSKSLSNLLEDMARDPGVGGYVQTQLFLSELGWQFIRELVERSSFPGAVFALREPLSSKYVAQIASGIKEVLTWDYVQKQLDSIWSNPTDSLKQLIEKLPSNALELMRSTSRDPKALYKILVAGNDKRKRCRLMGTTLLTLSAYGSYQLSDGKTLLDHVLCLDPFSECGRYVEADGDKTVLDLVIEKRGAVGMLVLSAEL